MKVGDRIYTPRFCTVEIEKIFNSREEAYKEGYTEPTHYEGDYKIVGKSLDMFHMAFGAYKKEVQ